MARIYAVAGDVTASPIRTLNVTPANTDLADYDTRTIRANTAGVIAVVNADGTTCLANFLAGETRVMCVRQISIANAAGTTTCTGIEAGF